MWRESLRFIKLLHGPLLLCKILAPRAMTLGIKTWNENWRDFGASKNWNNLNATQEPQVVVLGHNSYSLSLSRERSRILREFYFHPLSAISIVFMTVVRDLALSGSIGNANEIL